MTYRPESKRPIGKKYINYDFIFQELELSPDFDRWLSSNSKITFPDFPTWKDAYDFEKKRNDSVGLKTMYKNKFTSKKELFEIPRHYDSSNDKEKYDERVSYYLDGMAEMLGDKFIKEDHIEGVNFGDKNFEWVNKYLDKIYEKYSEYYVNDVLTVWTDFDGADVDKAFDYPQIGWVEKGYFLSELVQWLQEIGLDTNGFYEWIQECDFIEGRTWNITSEYPLSDAKYNGTKAPDNVLQINELIKQLLKPYMSEDMDEFVLPIYIDYKK